MNKDMELSEMPNIGTELEKKLKTVNITDSDDLKIHGTKGAFLRLNTLYPEESCVNMLYSIEGAIRGIRWQELSPEIKEDLLNYYNRIK
jgi:DNA transformation protein